FRCGPVAVRAARRATGRALDRSRELSRDATLYRRRRRRYRARGRVHAGTRTARTVRTAGGGSQIVRRAQTARDRGHARRGAGSDGAPGRARAAGGNGRAGGGGTQVHAACFACAPARIIEPAGCGLFGAACAVPLAAVQGIALRAVLVARVGRRWALCGRGGLSAGSLTLVFAVIATPPV